MKENKNIAGFSIIEVLIGIFIFTLGLISIYLIMVSSLKLNDYNKNQIIASNLAREQIELLRNTRDSNYKTLYAWNSIPGTSDKLTVNSYYKVSNDWNNVSYPVKIETIPGMDDSWAQESEVRSGGKMENFHLCLDSENRYTFNCVGNQSTPFYKYVYLESVPSIADAVKVVSKVIWYKRGYHEIEINTIMTDWKRL